MRKYKYYDRTYPLTFPSGKTMTPDEMASSDIYTALGRLDCAIITLSDGVTYEYRLLGELKNEYGVENDDPVSAVEEVNEVIKRQENERDDQYVSIQEIQAQMDALCGIES